MVKQSKSRLRSRSRLRQPKGPKKSRRLRARKSRQSRSRRNSTGGTRSKGVRGGVSDFSKGVGAGVATSVMGAHFYDTVVQKFRKEYLLAQFTMSQREELEELLIKNDLSAFIERMIELKPNNKRLLAVSQKLKYIPGLKQIILNNLKNTDEFQFNLHLQNLLTQSQRYDLTNLKTYNDLHKRLDSQIILLPLLQNKDLTHETREIMENSRDKYSLVV